MCNPVGAAIYVHDVEACSVEVGSVEPTETDHHTAFIAAKVSDILLLSAAAICGMMETLRCSCTDYVFPAVFGAEAEMLPGSTLGFLINALTAFAAIKSQGETGFPFQTHPQAMMISLTSLLVYGLASAAENIFYPSGVDPPSMNAIVARLGRIGSLCTLVGSLAFLFYF